MTAKDLDFQTLSGLVEEIAMLWEETAKLQEIDKEYQADVAVLGILQIEILFVKKAVNKIFPISEKTRDACADGKKIAAWK